MINAADIKEKMKEIKHHYDSNLHNKYVKHIIMKLDIPYSTTQDLKKLLESEIVYVDTRGAVEDLYNGIRAVGVLMKEIEVEVVPNIKAFADSYSTKLEPNERVLFQMAIRNYPMNVDLLGQKVFELYKMVFAFDKYKFSDNPGYKHINDFQDIEKYYVKYIMNE